MHEDMVQIPIDDSSFDAIAGFKQGRNSTVNDPQSGHLKCSTTDEQDDVIHFIVLVDWRLTVQ